MSQPLESYKQMLIYQLETSPEIGKTWFIYLDRLGTLPGVVGPYETLEKTRRAIDMVKTWEKVGR